MTHPTDETLQRLVDGELSSATDTEVRTHLETCVDCRNRASDLEALIARVGALLPSIDPDEDLWPGIADRLGASADDGKGVGVGPGPVGRAPSSRGTARNRDALRAMAWVTAAAAILTVGIALGRGLPRPSVPLALETTVATPPTMTLVADDAAYDATIADLREVLAGMRADLQPETVEAIEENLRIIDSAIDDARVALAADPASDFLLHRISIYKQTKLDVLRAATSVAVTSEI